MFNIQMDGFDWNGLYENINVSVVTNDVQWNVNKHSIHIAASFEESWTFLLSWNVWLNIYQCIDKAGNTFWTLTQ